MDQVDEDIRAEFLSIGYRNFITGFLTQIQTARYLKRLVKILQIRNDNSQNGGNGKDTVEP